jgi:hypothetical protein
MEKATLAIVPTQINDYQDFLTDVISELKKRHRKNEIIDPYETIEFLVVGENNSEIQEWFADNDLMSKAEFKKALAKKKKDEKIKSALGFIPKDPLDYINNYTKQQNISSLLTGELVYTPQVKVGDQVVTLEDRQKDRNVDTYYRLMTNSSFNTEDLKLDLRIKRDELDLQFRDSQIADAVSTWMKTAKQERRTEMLMSIAYQVGKATGPEGIAMWEKMEKASFDVTTTAPGFPTAIIKKFMWQVKRKATGLQVTDHLMPVITGKQGSGKSTIVMNMLKPINDAMRIADFRSIIDDKLIDLWESLVLFMDEMSGAKKADMDIVKQAITAVTLTRRPMRSNDSVTVKQRSTFIGCSNDSLTEIIRDTTGGRRFAELTFSDTPDWQAMNEIDWEMLWQSVDEHGNDPSLHCFDVLKKQQEENRNQTSVEMWAELVGSKFKTWSKGAELFDMFRTWEKEAFPNMNTNIMRFGTQMKKLNNWESEKRSGYVYYRFA